MALSYGLAVLASLVVALTVTPALGLLLMQKAPVSQNETGFAAWVQRQRTPRAAFAIALVATLAGAAMLPMVRLSPVPEFKEPDLVIKWDAAPGTSHQAMTRIIDRVAGELRALPGVRHVGAHVGRAIMSDQIVNVDSSELWVSIDPSGDYESTVAAVSEVVNGYPGADADVVTFLRSRFGEALSGVDEPIVVAVYGQELDVLKREAEKVKTTLAAVDGIVDPHVEIDEEQPAVEIEVDLQAAKAHGIKPGDVRRAAATLISGLQVGNLFEDQKVFEVVVWGVPSVRHSVAGIHDLLIDTPAGDHVRLGDVASVRIISSPAVIRREDVARRIDVAANVHGRSVDAVAADVRDRLLQSSFPLEYRAELTGDFAQRQAARARVIGVSIAAAVGILFMLQAAFGSWGLALAILLTLPMALAGGVLASAAGGGTLALGSLAGFLTILGLAVRQSMALVHRYRDLRHTEGLAFGPEVVERGTRDRVAAVWTTALVTAAAVLPFVVFRAAPGNEILGPLAMVVLGGLVTSTLYVLAVVPMLYSKFGANAMVDTSMDDMDVREPQRAAA
jgi:Cu/Ag efflux pump CusA